VYDVLYIPFSTVVLEPEQYGSVHTRNYIDCQIYNIEKFIDMLGGLDKSLLPVMAALLGNDYIEHSVFENFLSQIKLPKNSSVSKTQRQIVGLFQWLRKETTETAVEKVSLLYQLSISLFCIEICKYWADRLEAFEHN
jgi:hypothetical protein